MMKKLFLVAFTALLLGSCTSELDSPELNSPEPTTAQIHGSVVINGEPVNAAAILLTPGGGTKITGSDGYYDFSGLEPGRYELKVFKEGCQSFNKSIELVAGKDESLDITLSLGEGKLSINKAFIDMGSNESNNLAGFTIKNTGEADIEWTITKAASWITEIKPENGTIPANGAEAVSFTINRSKLSANTKDNYTTLLVKSATTGDGSVAELLVTVFGTGNGTNTTNDNSDLDYVIVGDLYVQTKDISDSKISQSSAKRLCEASIVGGFNDWRLPTLEELALLYNEREKIGNFTTEDYWSGSTFTGNNGSTYCYYISFSDGSYNNWRIDLDYCYARAVRKNELPVVQMAQVSNITESSVTFNGVIEDAGSPAYTERGFVYNTSHMPTLSNSKVVSYTATSSAQFSAEVNDLALGSTYYIRAYATSKTGTVYSDEITFAHTTQQPVVETLKPTDVGVSSAVLHGNITSKGIPAYTERGFVYSKTFKNPTISDTKRVVSGTGTGNFSLNLSGLTTHTTYYVRAYATNSEGTAYGESFSFYCTGQLPVVKTLSPTDIGVNSAVLHGSITSSGTPTYTERGFVYSKTVQNPTINDTKRVVSGTGVGQFRTNLSGLTTQATYYVRAYATNSEGTTYGETVSFVPEHPDYVVLSTLGLMVQRKDISTSALNWSSADQLCENSTVGGFTDWRLPTLDELTSIYGERNKIGNFKTSTYWSSKLNNGYYGYYYYVSFSSGEYSYGSYSSSRYARAVRTIK